ncbi:DUF2796 domain-containing protein [Uliginosibacterium sp. H1]|uniref:DUF2796 domain-containing protein n=1 Tax=Uliginosibacterium sp. H1 TaxID=3114757 RepID=UPI002E1921CB|nr:DUF2796 domain-containing protein [Uliginosibacterium sp. H1]
MRLPSLLLLSALLSTALATPLARAHGDHKHVHGVGELAVSVEGDTLTIALESPLDNFVGFERAPKYAKDMEAVKNMAATLRKTETLFVPTAAAQCAPVSVKLASEAVAPELLGEPRPATPPAAFDEDHVDLDAQWTFRCANPAALNSVEVKLFDAFKRFRQFDAVLVTPKRQSAARLNSKSRKLSW